VGDYKNFRKNVFNAVSNETRRKRSNPFNWEFTEGEEADLISGTETGREPTGALPSFIRIITKDSTKMTKKTDFEEKEDGPVRDLFLITLNPRS